MGEVKTSWYTFKYDPTQWSSFSAKERALVEKLDGWHCFAYENSYWMKKKPGEDRVWAKFNGAHDLDPFSGQENLVPVPRAALTPYELWPDYTEGDALRDHKERKKIQAQRKRLYGKYRRNEGCINVDLGSMDGFAGIIIPDSKSGIRYSWLTDGTALCGASTRGYFIPIQGWASERLHHMGDNVYRNDHRLDEEYINDILEECLDGWIVDPELVRVSREAEIWCRCVRPLHSEEDEKPEPGTKTISDIMDGAKITKDEEKEIRRQVRRWTIHSPFSGGFEGNDFQRDLIGRRAVLVWGNSD